MLAGAACCPFCAHARPIVRAVRGGYAVACAECNAAGPAIGGRIEDAVRAWNQRVGLLTLPSHDLRVRQYRRSVKIQLSESHDHMVLFGAMIFLAIALIVWGHLLIGGTILVAIALIMWDNRYMQRQAESKVRELQKPFPDLEKFRDWTDDIQGDS